MTTAERILDTLSKEPGLKPLTWAELNTALPSIPSTSITASLEQLQRDDLVARVKKEGVRGRPWAFALTDEGMIAARRKAVKQPGGLPAAKATPPVPTVAPAKAEEHREKPSGLPHVALDPAQDRDRSPESRLDLTIGSDGMLEIVVVGSEWSALFTPAQTRQLGEFLTSTSGVWQRPF